MNNMIPGNEVATAPKREIAHKTHWYKPVRCSICTTPIWLSPIGLQEPAGAPGPRRTWVLCRLCHEALLIEMRRSPIRTPLRLRIAMGLVAADRSPAAYGSTGHIRDQRRIIGIALFLFIAMILHLTLIVFLATSFLK